MSRVLFLRVFLLLLVIFALSACSTTGYKQSTSTETASQKEGVAIETVPAPMETQVFYMKPVVKKLLKRASHKFDEKDYHSTVSLLEQAIDISPNNPFIWQRLAMVRLKQQNYPQAEQLAVKSNVLGESNDELRMTNWQIIAEAKRGQRTN